MSTLSSDQAVVLPASGDPANAVTMMASYNTNVEARLVKRYASASDRTVRNPTPTEGELSYLADSIRYEFYRSSQWTPMPGQVVAQLRQTNAQALPSSATTPITFNVEDFDYYNGHDSVTNPSRYTIQRNGVYMVSGGVAIVGNTGGAYRDAQLLKNGVMVAGSEIHSANLVSASWNIEIPLRTVAVSCVAGDYLELATVHLAGVSLTTAPQSVLTFVFAGGI